MGPRRPPRLAGRGSGVLAMLDNSATIGTVTVGMLYLYVCCT
jgi:hypothetical protein